MVSISPFTDLVMTFLSISEKFQINRDPPLTELQLFQNTRSMSWVGQSLRSYSGSDVVSIYTPFMPFQSDHFSLRFGSFDIWPWKSSSGSRSYTNMVKQQSFSFHTNRTIRSWDKTITKWPWKFKVKAMGRLKRQKKVAFVTSSLLNERKKEQGQNKFLVTECHWQVYPRREPGATAITVIRVNVMQFPCPRINIEMGVMEMVGHDKSTPDNLKWFPGTYS